MESLPENAAIVINKTDLPQALQIPETKRTVLRCSAKQPQSLGPIREYLIRFTALSDRMAVTQPRHLDAMRRAVQALEAALETVRERTPDLAATDLQTAQEALGEITGDRVDEKLLDAVFSQFCVGK